MSGCFNFKSSLLVAWNELVMRNFMWYTVKCLTGLLIFLFVYILAQRLVCILRKIQSLLGYFTIPLRRIAVA